MYTPIDFLNDTHGHQYVTGDELYKLYNEHFDGMDVFKDKRDFTRFVLSPDFLKDLHRGKYAKFNKFAFEFTPVVLEHLKLSVDEVQKSSLQLITEWRDYLLAGIHFDEWAQTKQVYKLDKDFCLALQNTEKIKIDKNVITHLPINTFYLDLSDLDHPAIHGLFVFLDHDGDSVYLTLYALTHDKIFFSHHMYFNFSENDDMKVNKSELLDNDPYILEAVLQQEPEHRKITHDFHYKDFTTIVLHTLMYLGSSEPDLVENATTKQTYKPRKQGSPIKNKFSEVQMFDVGFKYGAAFRKKLKEYNIQRKDISFIDAEHEKTRKSPAPHIRCAHWAHRWAGPKTDQYLKLVWIEPCFVGFGDIEKTDTATIHKIK